MALSDAQRRALKELARGRMILRGLGGRPTYWLGGNKRLRWQTVDALVDAGYAADIGEDHRGVCIGITPEGRKALEREK